MREINKELEECLDELFPKERTSDEDLYRELGMALFPEDIFEIIKKIQNESGRDRALVLVALAQKKINELEGEIEDLQNEFILIN